MTAGERASAAGLSGLSPANFIAPSAVRIPWGYFVHLRGAGRGAAGEISRNYISLNCWIIK